MPAGGEGFPGYEEVEPRRRARLERIYRSFNAGELDRMIDAMGERFEFHSVTGRRAGRLEPYRGPEGLRTYADDVKAVWTELRITPQRYLARGDLVLVLGRVWGRTEDQLTDSPAAWLWRFEGDELVWARAFQGRDEALRLFAEDATEPFPGPAPG